MSKTENAFLPAGTELHHGDGGENPALDGRAAALSGGRSGRAQLLEEAVQRDSRAAEGGQRAHLQAAQPQQLRLHRQR